MLRLHTAVARKNKNKDLGATATLCTLFPEKQGQP